jgi:hypothetical protein
MQTPRSSAHGCPLFDRQSLVVVASAVRPYRLFDGEQPAQCLEVLARLADLPR